MKKTFTLFCALFVLLSLFAASCSNNDSEQEVAVIIALTQTAAPQQTEAAAIEVPATGTISGIVSLLAPRTPVIYIYALDPQNGTWFTTQSEESDSVGSYTLEVAPGTYQLFGFAENGAYLGYSPDSWELAQVEISAGETLTDINLNLPGYSECGDTFGVPASPDGRFAKAPGPDEVCKKNLLESMGSFSAPTLVLNGTISLQGSDIPAMTVYAVDSNQEVWYSMDTTPQQGTAVFNMEVTEGNYLLMAYADNGEYAALTGDGWSLTEISAVTGQDVSGLNLTAPAQTESGPSFMLPASPDGRYPAASSTAAIFDSELKRIAFESGATSNQISRTLAAGTVHSFVLTIMAQQQLIVYLNPESGAVLDVRGADGNEVISIDDQVSACNEVVPTTQDYYIDVISTSSYEFTYTMSVHIPAGTVSANNVYPETEPFGWDDMEMLVLTGVPIILPPEFPVEEGLPDIYPYVIYKDADFFEISLDYGIDCHGAGACHYGVMAGKRTYEATPSGTVNYPFMSDQAQQVSLAKASPVILSNQAAGQTAAMLSFTGSTRILNTSWAFPQAAWRTLSILPMPPSIIQFINIPQQLKMFPGKPLGFKTGNIYFLPSWFFCFHFLFFEIPGQSLIKQITL